MVCQFSKSTCENICNKKKKKQMRWHFLRKLILNSLFRYTFKEISEKVLFLDVDICICIKITINRVIFFRWSFVFIKTYYMVLKQYVVNKLKWLLLPTYVSTQNLVDSGRLLKPCEINLNENACPNKKRIFETSGKYITKISNLLYDGNFVKS